MRVARGGVRRNFGATMNSAVTSAHPVFFFKKAGWRDTGLLLAVAWLIPFAIHLAPWSGERPLGAYVLPMFWTTLIAVYFYGAGIGVLTGLFAPAVNLVLTGLPAARGLGFAGLELVLFVAAFALTVRRWPRVVLLAPMAYVVAKIGVALLQFLLGDAGVSAGGVAHSLERATPGLIVLAAINAALIWFFPRSGEAAK